MGAAGPSDVPVSDALVFFGATGDLAYKQIFPALQAMVRHGLSMPIIGVAKAGWNREQLLARARDSLQHHGDFNESDFGKLVAFLRYVDGDYRDPATFQQLRQALDGAQRPLHYFAIPPSMFETVATGLAGIGATENARVVVEKPFGHDLKSAQELNRALRKVFAEEAIFRIDHYLGKEPVENLLYTRFANLFLEPIWNRHYINCVQLTMAENFGVQGRGAFYDEAGAIRDVIQNHMLQVASLVAMEPPFASDADAVRDQKALVMKAVRPLTPNDIVRGQFRGYRDEPGVKPDSRVETFAAVRLHIDNWRWSGVPFFIRAGKCLPITTTEVYVQLKRPPRHVFADTDEEFVGRPNYVRFRLSPDVFISLGAQFKKPGEAFVGERVELVGRQQPAEEMPPYERLLGDAKHGNQQLFARQDMVEAAWRVVDPVLDPAATPVYEYEPNTWGPAEVERIKPPDGWEMPTPSGVSPK